MSLGNTVIIVMIVVPVTKQPRPSQVPSSRLKRKLFMQPIPLGYKPEGWQAERTQSLNQVASKYDKKL